MVYAIQTLKNQVWISTSRGVSMLNFDTGEITNLSSKDGLQSGGFTKSNAIDTINHIIFFGGKDGINTINATKIVKNPHKPKTIITSLYINNKKMLPTTTGDDDAILTDVIENTKQIVLNYDQNSIYFTFSSMHLAEPFKNKYAFKLEGFDNDWTYTDAAHRFATYTNLEHGKYTFLVKSANNSGIWTDEATTIFITIRPPFWATWWFRLLIFLILVGLMYWTYKTLLLRANKQRLENLVEQRTKELVEKNQRMSEMNEELNRQQEELISTNDLLVQQKEELVLKNDYINQQNQQIENAFQQIETAYNDIKQLSEFGQKLAATLDIAYINKTVYSFVSEFMDTSVFGIAAFNEERNTLDYIGYIEEGISKDAFSISLSEKDSLSVYCFTNEKNIVIDDFHKQYSLYVSKKPQFRTKKEYNSLVYLPLRAENKLIGVVSLQSSSLQAYSEKDVSILQSVATYLSFALENSRAYEIIRERNQSITDSIRYANTIQAAILPSISILQKQQYDAFILYKPKDIVSGDFYWISEHENKTVVATVDCTGHGVPGAFMSLIGYTILKEAIIQKQIFEPAAILEILDENLRAMLRQGNQDGSNADGMDVCLCVLTKSNDKTIVEFSGAKRSLIYINSQNEVLTLKADKKSIGGLQLRDRRFTNQSIELVAGNTIYLSTDGFIDQANPEGKKFGSPSFYNLLKTNQHLNMTAQKEVFEIELAKHQSTAKQRDDITVIGIKC
jgi:serine phosphatase RsbU (regulator of sigma subunit)